ncbi:hypothetical protein LCGC14_0235000 [marine sediment metagenome]|uniref:Uncharacterized protein n=1 Tax=marine sediment metagenome TaxID=412755 RepID=A0A0F9UDB2_9ZZZZ
MVEIKIKLTKSQREAIASGAPVSFIILPTKASRAEIIRGEGTGARLDADVLTLVNAWNEHPYIRYEAVQESRNNPITIDEVDTHGGVFKKAIKEVGVSKLLERMGSYFEACRQDRHIWEGRNHGYSHLGGFLRKVTDCHAKRVGLWWTKDGKKKLPDKDPGLTLAIANAYAKKFLGRKAFGLKNPGQDYESFMVAGEWLKGREDKPLPRGQLITLLLDVVEDAHGGLKGAVPPSWLGSERTWKVGIPAALKGMFG